MGLVVGAEGVAAGKALELREIISTLEAEPFMPASRLAFVERLATHACAKRGRVLASLLPAGMTEPLLHEVRRVEGADVPDIPERWVDAATLKLSPSSTCTAARGCCSSVSKR